MKYKTLIITIIFLLINILPVRSIEENIIYKEQVEENVFVEQGAPINILSFNDLVELSKQANPEGELKDKLENQLSMVHIINKNIENKLDKPFVRVGHWNVEYGKNWDKVIEIFTDPKSYENKYSKKRGKRFNKHLKDELYSFKDIDVFCVVETDIGLPRSQYKNTVKELADVLNWNWAFVTEFVELGPIHSKLHLDESKYKGIHGNAIISRFPIVKAEVIRLPGFYDWYSLEIKKKQSPLEHIRKLGAKSIFSQLVHHGEVRHGNRNALVADIKLPNGEIITVISTHLEDRAYPDERLKQFDFLLENIKDIKNPVIFSGDFNTSTTDSKPTYFKKEVEKRIRDPHFILRTIGSSFVPGVPVVSGLGAVGFSKLLQYKDPFYPNIPVIFPNHERKFYTHLKKFRFADGNAFDLSGDKERSYKGKKGLLSSSNQRHWKGFKSSFKFEEPRIIAYFKLDWFFVKPLGNRFLPFNGRTYKTLNIAFKGGVSDHNPLTVDIKLEPHQVANKD